MHLDLTLVWDWPMFKKICYPRPELKTAYTVNVTGETLVLNKNFPSIKKDFPIIKLEQLAK